MITVLECKTNWTVVGFHSTGQRQVGHTCTNAHEVMDWTLVYVCNHFPHHWHYHPPGFLDRTSLFYQGGQLVFQVRPMYIKHCAVQGEARANLCMQFSPDQRLVGSTPFKAPFNCTLAAVVITFHINLKAYGGPKKWWHKALESFDDEIRWRLRHVSTKKRSQSHRLLVCIQWTPLSKLSLSRDLPQQRRNNKLVMWNVLRPHLHKFLFVP